MKGVSIIAACAKWNAIGCEGKMPWHLPEDLKMFKERTMGHPVIMGRRTWESLPKGALPGRTNIVLTSNPDFEAPGALKAASLEEAVKLASESDGGEEIFVIGGGNVYRQALPLAEKIYLTRIRKKYRDADTYFPFLGAEWVCKEATEDTKSANDLIYHFESWQKK